MRLRDLIEALKDTYTRTFGAEYMYISDTPTKRFVQERLEPIRSRPNYSVDERKHILERLTAAETLERYLHTKYVGQKRFSGEGGDSMIPMLDLMIQRAGAAGVQEIVLGMAHRGRLNVLVNTLGKMPSDLFSEFEGKAPQDLPAGDVKYHQGFSSDISTPGGPVHVTLAFNPSHLEIVNPVVEGSVRARQHRRHDRRGDQVLPVLIHGDAAIAGQGVVQECLNMAQTRGYYTGGTIHVVINNQIGFTTSDPRDVRGTLYCTDVAKMVEAPIFHVNGDDPEACLLATELAFDYRQRFHKDVFIDLVCFRRLGHNEADEPMITQPLMYKKINQHPGTRKLYADRLVAEGVLSAEDADAMIATYRAAMDKGYHTNTTVLSNYKPPFIVDWSAYKGRHWTDPADTTVPMARLTELGIKATTVPSDFKLHSRVEKLMADRRAMVEGKVPIDWGMGEIFAYASLLDQDYGVRISGEDVGRGTFSHRHAVLHDQNREKWDSGTWVPLQHIKEGQPDFEIIDSVLTENAVLGFEYGYTTSEPNQLVIWEAQFGDFANGAQVVIDQFISAGEVKWGRICDLVLFLPSWVRRAGARAFVGAARTLSATLRAAQHASGRAHDACADVPSAAPADDPAVSQAADRHHAEEPATPQGSGVDARRPCERPLPERHSRSGQARSEEGASRHRMFRQGLLRAAELSPAERHRRRCDHPARAAISVSARGLQARDRDVREGEGSGLVPGGAAEPGRLVSTQLLPARRHRREEDAGVCRPPGIRIAGRRLRRETQRRAEAADRGCVRRQAQIR
jgi:2-oxoglutarate dehydrogenase E1 component